MNARLRAMVLAPLLGAAALPAWAQYAEPTLGHLFTAPDERMRLDRGRTTGVPVGAPSPLPPAPPPEAAAPPAPAPAPQRFTGVVRRSDGRATVWIDDEPRETALGRLRAGRPIPVDTAGGRVLMKPGQSYDPGDGAVRDPR